MTSDRLIKRASSSCCNFLCVVLAAAYLKYRRCRLSCLPFVWHYFSLWHTHTHTHTVTHTHTHTHTHTVTHTLWPTHSDLCMLDGLFFISSYFVSVHLGMPQWDASFSRTVAFCETCHCNHMLFNICQWILIHLCTSAAFMCWEETAYIEPAAEAPCHQQKWRTGDGVCWHMHAFCIQQLLVLALHNCTIGSFSKQFSSHQDCHPFTWSDHKDLIR